MSNETQRKAVAQKKHKLKARMESFKSEISPQKDSVVSSHDEITLRTEVLRDVTPCQLLDIYRRFDERSASNFRVKQQKKFTKKTMFSRMHHFKSRKLSMLSPLLLHLPTPPPHPHPHTLRNWRYLLDVCLSVQRCICVEKKNQLDATEHFIALIICSTCFRHFYAHHQELETICVLLPPMVCDALVAGCRRSGADSRLCVQDEVQDSRVGVQDEGQSSRLCIQDEVQGSRLWVQDEVQGSGQYVQDEVQGSRQCVQNEGCSSTAVELHLSSWTHSLLLCTWPPTTTNEGTAHHRR